MTEKIIGMSKVHGTNKITLVEDVVKALKVKLGDNILFVLKDGDVILRRA